MSLSSSAPSAGEFVAMKYQHNPHAAFSVDWYIGKRCNFDCSYCADYLHDKTSPHVPKDRMIQLVDKLQAAYGANILWSICGGEPTIIPHLIEVMEYINRRGARDVSITTNLSRTTDYFLELFPHINNITASLHFEAMGHQAQAYAEKVIALEQWRRAWNLEHPGRRKTLLIRFMMYPGKFQQILQMKEQLERAGVEKIEFRYIRPLRGLSNEQMPTKKMGLEVNHDELEIDELHTDGTRLVKKVTPAAPRYEAPNHKIVSNADHHATATIKRAEEWYSTEEKEIIHQLFSGEPKKFLKLFFVEDGEVVETGYHYNQLNFERKNNFEGWLCWAGVKHMKITPSGDIYIGSCHVGGKLGNIYELKDDFVLPQEPVVCPKWRCTDNLDLRVPKVKRAEFTQLVADRIVQAQPGL